MENKTKGAGDDYPVIPLAQKTFRVRITKASSSQSWYKNKVGQEFDVYVNPDGDKTAFILEQDRLASITQRFISSFDCEPVEQINKYVEMQKELASMKEVVKELIPIAEETASGIVGISYIGKYRAQSIIDRAKRLSDNK